MGFFQNRLHKKLAAYQREIMETHCRETETMYQEMRGWRHDFRNHLQLLKSYAQKGDLDAVRAYLAELEQDRSRRPRCL